VKLFFRSANTSYIPLRFILDES